MLIFLSYRFGRVKYKKICIWLIILKKVWIWCNLNTTNNLLYLMVFKTIINSTKLSQSTKINMVVMPINRTDLKLKFWNDFSKLYYALSHFFLHNEDVTFNDQESSPYISWDFILPKITLLIVNQALFNVIDIISLWHYNGYIEITLETKFRPSTLAL